MNMSGDENINILAGYQIVFGVIASISTWNEKREWEDD